MYPGHIIEAAVVKAAVIYYKGCFASLLYGFFSHFFWLFFSVFFSRALTNHFFAHLRGRGESFQGAEG